MELVTEDKQSEAAKQAKLKGYVSIGFGRWADKFGNMVAFTTKSGRLAPYTPPDDPESSKGQPAAQSDEESPESNQPDAAGSDDEPGYQSAADTSSRGSSPPVGQPDEQAVQFNHQAEQVSAKALLLLLKWIAAGKLNDNELDFYTGDKFREYALTMKDSVIALNNGLASLYTQKHDAIQASGGKITIDFDTLFQVTAVLSKHMKTMLVDISEQGPSFHYAQTLSLHYAGNVKDYDINETVLRFDYSTIKGSDSSNNE